MKVKELTETLHDKYGKDFLGLSGGKDETTIYFNDDPVKTIKVSSNDSNEDILKEIEKELGE